MNVLIIGANGSMGTRYRAILAHLGVNYWCVDKGDQIRDVLELAEKATHVIVATPTETHLSVLASLSEIKCPILCEKPLAKSYYELVMIRDLVLSKRLNLTMTMQYKMLDDVNSEGLSSYDYFKHGSDGLNWDCLQIIALARGEVSVKERSPVWKCTLNGKILKLSDMDMAYIKFIEYWLENPGDDIDDLIRIHEKVIDYGT